MSTPVSRRPAWSMSTYRPMPVRTSLLSAMRPTLPGDRVAAWIPPLISGLLLRVLRALRDPLEPAGEHSLDDVGCQKRPSESEWRIEEDALQKLFDCFRFCPLAVTYVGQGQLVADPTDRRALKCPPSPWRHLIRSQRPAELDHLVGQGLKSQPCF